MNVTPFLVCFSVGSVVFAQDFPRKDVDPARIADELYGIQDQDLNYEDLFENLLQLLAHPIDLSKASIEELRFLKILSEEQIADYMKYIDDNGKLISVYELQAIPGFDPETISKLAPLVKVSGPESALNSSLWRRMRQEGDSYLILRYDRSIEQRSGFTNAVDSLQRFRGSPDRLYLRFRSSRPGDYSLGFTIEKDPGENLEWQPKLKYYGFDFLSFHARIQNKGRLKNLIIGDFQGQFAQGIVLGGGFGTGKGSETILTCRRSNIGMMPYTSVNEAGFLRGLAATIEVSPKVYVTGFYSRAKRDANLSYDSSGTVISSFQSSGLHRNLNELSKRNLITDQNAALVIQYKTGQMDAGVMYNAVNFNVGVVRNRTPYNQFTFEGKVQQNIGGYINYEFRNVAFFSEFARSFKGGNALIAGVLLGLSSKFDMAVLYRNFSRNFHSFYSNAFGENGITQNESGIYWGYKYRFNHKFGMSGYVDLFQFPWLRYRAYAPSIGHEWLLRFTFQPSRKVMMFLQAREEKKDRNTNDNTLTYVTAIGKKHNYWIGVEYGLRQKLRMKTRAQFSTYQFNGMHTRGMALLQDITAEIGKFQITARYALTDTDDYDNRQYVYENDVWLAYSMPAYSGVGTRKVVLLEYKFNRFITVWLRFASSRFPKEEKIGSGPDAIATNVKNDVKFQLRIMF